MNNKLKFVVAGILTVLAVVAVLAVVSMNDRYEDIVDDISQLKTKAEQLYEMGDIAGAISQMEIYCVYVSTDNEAMVELGDWYYKAGDEYKAYECYYNAASNKRMEEERIPFLGVKNVEEIVLQPINEVVMEITPDVRMTKNMKLLITGHNLVPEKKFEGKIQQKDKALAGKGCYTTDWFVVNPEGEYLTMSGGFNCAIWQFKNKRGDITHYSVSPNKYRGNNSYDTDVYQMARVIIPEKARMCRVTYYDEEKAESTADMEEELTIVYGRLPGESSQAVCYNYEIPDLKDGEKIVYKNGEWSHVKGDDIIVLEDWDAPKIERGSYIAVSGTLPGRVSFKNSVFADYSKDGIYTIRFDTENPSATGERLDDAQNMGFNAAVAEGRIALGANDFDNVYPWKDIKLCALKDGKVVAYEGKAGFSADGSSGDVFVEIPKFYVKRVFDGKYDSISISGFCHPGFEVDDAFVTKNGEADKIYIAAYLTGMDENGEISSISSATPVFELSSRELSEKIKAKGNGYEEIDYAALSAVQKLFMVETGMRNSQYLYMGVCGYTAVDDDIEDSYPIAVKDNRKTNCIVINEGYVFEEGNSVILFNNNSFNNRDKRIIKTVINNNDGTISVFLDGEPFNVKKGITALTHTALRNGTSRKVGSHTGAMSTARGTVAFKYRNIENLWGNAYVYIDKVVVTDRKVTLETRKGKTVVLSYELPNQQSDEKTDNMVKKIGYDPNLKQVLLPSVTGDGATISTYYGDLYEGGKESGEEYVLHFGGCWSSKACAGLFSYMTTSKADDVNVNTTGRMMYIG